MKLQQLIQPCAPRKVVGSLDKEVTGIEIDSRCIQPGAVFVAMRGTQVDGHAYIGKAIELGATAVVCEQLPDETTDGVTYLVYPDTEEVVGPLATHYFGDPTERMHLIGMSVYQDMFRQQCTYIDDPAAFVRAQEGHVCKINLYHPNAAARARSRAALADLPLQPVVGEAASLELTPAGVSKALGLKLLCEHLGLSLAQCVAVGDAGNDLDVLQAAGHAVAMGNATPEARAVADEVVADNDHDGIAEVVARWF